MPLKALEIKMTPTDRLPRGRGFYQLEEETLFLPVEYTDGDRRYFSCLESSLVTIHLDRTGRLIFIELNLPRRRWRIRPDLIAPEAARPADIRFCDIRSTFVDPTVLCDHHGRHLMIRFNRGPAIHNFRMADNLIAQVDRRNLLTALWVSDIIDDFAGRELASWRLKSRRRLFRPVPA